MKYLPYIEEAIEVLQEKIEEKLPEERKYLSRWIALKWMDEEEKILQSIEENLKIELKNHEKIQEIENILKKEQIEKKDVKDKIISTIIYKAEDVCKEVVQYEKKGYLQTERKIDKILTSKRFGIPIMLVFLGLIFWLTIIGANYPSQLLSGFFGWLQGKIVYVFDYFGVPVWIKGILVDGMYRTLTWVIAVMLPPMAIFFPLFTILEDLGYLPRLSFNLDKYFRKAGSSRKTGTNHVHGIRVQCSRSGRF